MAVPNVSLLFHLIHDYIIFKSLMHYIILYNIVYYQCILIGFMRQEILEVKEKFTLFSDHKGSLPRRQPGAMLEVMFFAFFGTCS